MWQQLTLFSQPTPEALAPVAAFAMTGPLAVALAATPNRQPQTFIVERGLTPEEVREIRDCGLSASDAAARFKVSRWTAWRIQTGRYHATLRPVPRWRRVSDDTVEEIRVRHEESGWSIPELAGFYNLPRTTVLAFCQYRRR